MRPDEDASRVADDGLAAYKAAIYERTKAWLLVENDAEQAVAIADSCLRPG